MAITKHLTICLVGVICSVAEPVFAEEPVHAGFLYDEFQLTLAPGRRTEFFGPLFYSELKETQHQWAIPPLALSHTEDPAVESEEYDFLYPVLTYDRYGAEYRWQFFQLFGFGGGKNPDDSSTRRFSLFPIYFQQRSSDPTLNYTAVVPFYGHLDHRLFRDEIDFVLFPLYSKTRKKDVVTRNMPYPFFHLREGDGLHGWQVWPLMGREHKDITSTTNGFGDPVINGGHDSEFILWPFYTRSTNDIGIENPVVQSALIPFYSLYRSKLRDSTTWSWPIGVTHTVDREKKYEEWDYPWPFVEFAHGEGKTASRVWPFYSQAHNSSITANWYAWPIYKYNRIVSEPLDRERTRILYFLYSSVNEKNTESGQVFQRRDFWPFYTYRKELDGNQRLQVLAILEPIYPNNRGIERDYSPLYSFWRAEKNPKTGAASQSLLWNLYRRDTAPGTKKISLLFGLFQYQSNSQGSRWRVCYIPAGGTSRAAPAPLP
jgi:hypothetical protein